MWIILQAKEKSGRLYEIYCRYLLSYDTLTAEEKKKLEEKVLNKRERDPSAFDQPCVVKVTDAIDVPLLEQPVWRIKPRVNRLFWYGFGMYLKI